MQDTLYIDLQVKDTCQTCTNHAFGNTSLVLGGNATALDFSNAVKTDSVDGPWDNDNSGSYDDLTITPDVNGATLSVNPDYCGTCDPGHILTDKDVWKTIGQIAVPVLNAGNTSELSWNNATDINDWDNNDLNPVSEFVVPEDKALTGCNDLRFTAEVFLEGPYNASPGLMNSDITHVLDTLIVPGSDIDVPVDPTITLPGNTVDRIKFYLLAPSDPSVKVDSVNAWLIHNGSIRDFQTAQHDYVQFCNASEGDYYIGVWHRNHLSVMSDSLVYFETGTQSTFDFTGPTAIHQHQRGVRVISGTAVMRAGNARHDLEVNSNDFYDVSVANDLASIPGQYHQADLNLDGVVDAQDFNLCNDYKDQLYYSTVPFE